MRNLSEKRLGQTNKNKFGSLMKITDYKDANHIEITFIEHDYKTQATYGEFIKGKVRSPYCKTVSQFGFLGEGKYKVKIDGKLTKQYQTWSDMIKRCFSEGQLKRNKSYIGCTVDEKWSNFQIFAKWMDENYYEVDGQRMNLDKDILIKNNKIYSSGTCCFAPQFINTLFIKCDKARGKLPIGVSFHKTSGKYIVNGSIRHKGLYDTSMDAFLVYKRVKESYIKEIADIYREQIPKKLYTALMNYKIEITD